MRKILAATVALVCGTFAHEGQAVELLSNPYTLVGDDVDVHAFRFSATANKIDKQWTTGEKFPGNWVFKWKPSGELTLDGKELVVVVRGACDQDGPINAPKLSPTLAQRGL